MAVTCLQQPVPVLHAKDLFSNTSEYLLYTLPKNSSVLKVDKDHPEIAKDFSMFCE